MANNKLSMRIAAVLLSTTMLASVPLTTIYAEDEDLNNQLSGIQQQMEEAGNKKANAEVTITNVSEQLHQIQVELDQATANLKNYEQQRMAVENEIVKNEKLLAEAQARLSKREGVFNKRVRDIYINGRLSYLEVIIGAKDFSDFANRVEMLKRIIDADIKLISSIKTEREEISQRKATLEADRAKVVELENKAREAQAVIQKKKDEQSAILAQAQNDKAVAEQMQADLQASSDAIRAMLQQRAAERAAAAAAAHKPLNQAVAAVITRMYRAQANWLGRYPVLLRLVSVGVNILFSVVKFFTPVLISGLMKVRRYMRPTPVRLYIPVGWTVTVMPLLSTMVMVFLLYVLITPTSLFRKVNP